MGSVVGLLFAVGVLLVWQALSGANQPSATGTGVRGWLTKELQQAGIDTVTAGGLLWLCVLCGGGCAIVMLLLTRTPPIALAFGVIAAGAPVSVVRGRARKRRREFAEVWPEAVDNLASAVRAGLSLPEALAQLGDRGPAPLRPAFAAFGDDYLSTGQFGRSLDRLKARMADPVCDRVVEALRIAREVGSGDLGRVLRSLSGFLRDDARTRSELEARQAWVVNGARLAAGSPWAVLLVLSFQPAVIQRYGSATGVLVLLIGGGMCVVAYRLMLSIGRLPAEERVLQ